MFPVERAETAQAMTIEYSTSRPITASELSALFKGSGIVRPAADLERISRMIANSNLLIGAFEEGRLVGVARALTDFSYCCYLSDLAVLKEFQNRGIGRELLRILRERIGPECALILLSAPGAMEYYPKAGFQPISNGWMMKRER